MHVYTEVRTDAKNHVDYNFWEGDTSYLTITIAPKMVATSRYEERHPFADHLLQGVMGRLGKTMTAHHIKPTIIGAVLEDTYNNLEAYLSDLIIPKETATPCL